MKNIICTLLLIYCGSSFAQLEEFDSVKSDTTFNDRDLPIKILHSNSSGVEEGAWEFQYYENDSLKAILSSSEKGYVYFAFNEHGDIINEQTEHYSRVPANDYYHYEYSELGNIVKKYFLDTAMNVKFIEEFDYNAAETHYKQRRMYDSSEKLRRTTNYFYTADGSPQYLETFNDNNQLTDRTLQSNYTKDGFTHNLSYVYNNDNQLKEIYFRFNDKDGETQKSGFYKFQYEKGELKTFIEGYNEPQKVKKNLENKWVKEYYYVIGRNKNG
ncbi:MAG: hypothetical protein GQ574_04780 [Crocinitomix sp.]|nr:hypothetical protein [Crocinitomix sp.]